MIKKLFVGATPTNLEPNELQAPDTAFPKAQREWVKETKEAINEFVVWTTSPNILQEVVLYENYDLVFFVGCKSGKVTSLLELYDENWLYHFSMADLLMGDYFNEALELE